MAVANVRFNGVALSTFGFVSTNVSLSYKNEARGEAAAISDGGVVPESMLGTLQVRVTGTLIQTTNEVARQQLGLLLKALRGTDRVKKGTIDLYGDGYHYWGQLVEPTPVSLIAGEGNASLSLVFECDEPFRRADAMVSYSEVISVSDSTMVIDYATDFDGDAWRIPIVIRPTTGIAWAQNDVIRVYNVTVGWRFQHTLTQALSVGQALVLDGEVGEVLENGTPAGEGNAGTGLYIRGGVSNTLMFSGTTSSRLTGTWTVDFYDRFVG